MILLEGSLHEMCRKADVYQQQDSDDRKLLFSSWFVSHRQAFYNTIGWVFIIDSKCGALKPPFSTLAIKVDRFTLSLPFQRKLNILLTSLMASLCTHTRSACLLA